MVLFIVSYNAFNRKRSFIVLYNTELRFCFLIGDGYKYDVQDRSFTYGGGKNKGHMSLISSELSSDFARVKINGFKGSYKKSKNKRVYEYQLNSSYILRDVFVNAENMPVNLVPYREECSKIKSNFKNHIKIFEGV